MMWTSLSHCRCFLAQRVSFLEDQDVVLVSLGEHDDKRNKSWAPVGEETVLAALERVVDPIHHPILITCSTGKHRTGKDPQVSHLFRIRTLCINSQKDHAVGGVYMEVRSRDKYGVVADKKSLIDLLAHSAVTYWRSSAIWVRAKSRGGHARTVML